MTATPLTPVEVVRAHTRARSLSALRDIIVSEGEKSQQLGSIDALIAERTCFDPRFRLLAADALFSETVPSADAVWGIVMSGESFGSGPFFLTRTAVLERIVGHFGGQVAINEPQVNRAWTTAQKVLQELRLERLTALLNAVDLIAGINGPRGEVRALSNPLIPGFVAIGVDGPPLMLAEQAVHESTHVVLSARIALDESLHALTDAGVGVLSPFTNSIRSIDRVVHGILSYAAVSSVWRRADSSPSAEQWIELPDRKRADQVIKRRLQTLEARVGLAMICLFDSGGGEVCRQTEQLADELLGVQLPAGRTSVRHRAQSIARAGYCDDIRNLTAIERAELAFAENGCKVSRISVQLAGIANVGFALASRCAVAAASWTFEPVPDQKIGGFSNVGSDALSIMASGNDRMVHLYLHLEPEKARKAAILDPDDEAGLLLGIPKCCCEWYSNVWPEARKAGGDLFFEMVRDSASHGGVSVASECDASAMYRGGGLCWHFPCSPQCKETVAMVRRRRNYLKRFDLSLLAELDAAKSSRMTILSDGTYHDGVVIGDGAIVVTFT